MQAKLSALQYGFRAGVSTETVLPEFVLPVSGGFRGGGDVISNDFV